ncbi:hypothetical protein LPJ78_001872 [Coemansia sp. RSA 989]|nr:Pyruvate/Phosphoenolpyruvate kinase-like domain-containing protein [Coemansia mojavensis]KAJ1742330.1 hypothetical protein LPJ68_002039 [Coemansia sp. RSA 1086]KAJ1751682.1 hypothetical protein LPJ79_001846 [Coemansia sp. RSA 1821]KAJ1866407.1 hypothetical protein LPJ78_001872 [Coemansia sp. RSA 989]KAJ1872966.1 hypothetical protein LPJ55_002680 [Coemansia sp. RSA 990]KAJ2674492.1 hypothetical protein IWW42_001662 [Coemansia sp. RSA 1085]
MFWLRGIQKNIGSQRRLLSVSAPVPPGLNLKNERLRRSVFYVPCSEPRKVAKSIGCAADCVIYDLEDGVSMNRKEEARSSLLSALSQNQTRERGVRINSISSGMAQADLEVALKSERLDVLMVPKVQTANDLHWVLETMDNPKVRIIAAIETALGICNIREIAQVPQVDSLLFAAEDYCADTGIIRTEGRRELYYARSVVSTTAHAFGLQAIDMVTMDFRNPSILQEESQEAVEMGFTGKQLIHPLQIDLVNGLFAPQPQVVERAAEIVCGYREHYQRGKGAFDLNGKAIDMPVVKWAYRVLQRAELAGIDVTDKLNP